MELTMKGLEKCFEGAKKDKATWIAVAIQTKGSESSELIINPNVNFDSKLDYYKKAYTDDLVLKTYDGIQIKGFIYGDSLGEIEDYLFEEGEEI